MIPSDGRFFTAAAAAAPRLEVAMDATEAARRAAAFIAGRVREASAQGRCFVLALSGGETPRRLFQELSVLDVAWSDVHLAQVDERLAPMGHERNWTLLRDTLLDRLDLPTGNLHAMPVQDGEPEAAARRYGAELRGIAGAPPVLDLVHLGLGADGHTASLVPDDPVLKVLDQDVAVTGPYEGLRRMTLTFPVIDRARCLMWLVTGAGKAPMLERLMAGDLSIPAGRVARGRAVIFADRDAAPRGSPC